MDFDKLFPTLFGILCVCVFLVTFFLGDVVGWMIEAKLTRRWRRSAAKTGLSFDARRERRPFISSLLLPKIIAQGVRESVFTYGESLKTIRGTLRGFQVMISDFSIWDFHTRGPLIYRAVICVVHWDSFTQPDPIDVVRLTSILLHGFRLDQSFREYRFPSDPEFENTFVLFARQSAIPWGFSGELRNLCVRRKHVVDVLMIRETDLVVVSRDGAPERFHLLADMAVGMAEELMAGVPADPYR
ncbi:MAG: hypothetical protein V2B18_25485 [Pseudomonadota bacterium]